MSEAADATKALWVKCPACGHCWAAAYYPIDIGAFVRVTKRAICPKGCKARPVMAKQDDGVLLESTHPSTMTASP